MDYLCVIVMFFISCLDSHSDGTHSLQRNEQVMQLMLKFSQSIQMKKQTHLHLSPRVGRFSGRFLSLFL